METLSSSVDSPRLPQSPLQTDPASVATKPSMSALISDTPTSRCLTITLPKMTNFFTLASPKRQQQTQHMPSDKNEPSRFLGDGVSFKAKLIGILEVGEARGDRMCQEALADLKMAIRAAGEHKQRITINIAIDGLRLRDEKSTDCLYHHPVHKISFIAQDMTDSRAFGYIFGSPDTGHRFFGIKTDKAAGQVVVAMRDLFQVVFELKKKEIELAKQHIEQQQSKFSTNKSLENLVYSKHGVATTAEDVGSTSGSKSRSTRDELQENGIGNSSKSAQQTSEVIADLVDLEIELNSIQQGIHQMDKITPSDPFGPDTKAEKSFHDPFEDSFSPTLPGASSQNHPAILPPPSSSKSRASKRHTASSLTLDSTTPMSPPAVAPLANTETWFDTHSDPLFGNTHLPSNLTSANTTASAAVTAGAPINTKQEQMDECEEGASGGNSGGQFDLFTELDPLGTGKIKPYVDKKDFFQELKNPPKKLLNQLAGEHKENEPPPIFNAKFESTSPSTRHSTTYAASSPAPLYTTSSKSDVLALDPFADTDPFGDSETYVDEEHANAVKSFPNDPNDPFDTCFADFTMFGSKDKQGNAASVYHGPLRVSLPPEKIAAEESLLPPPPSSSRRLSPGPTSNQKTPRVVKQTSVPSATNLVRLPSPKVQSRSSRRLAKQTTLSDAAMKKSRSPPGTINILDEGNLSSSSLELTDIAPEPPPRPAASKPPPLPPKRQQQSCLALKPPPRPPPSEQYDYVNHFEDPEDPISPPLPVPVRRPKFQGAEVLRQHQTVDSQFSLPPAILREEKKKSTGAAANLTLRQLTKMNISELASSLNVSPGHLAKMTLQELASFLASVSTEGSPSSTTVSNKQEITTVEGDHYSTLRESVDDEVFKADFENNFTDFPVNFESNKTEDVFQEAPFDKYAVFRELLEQQEVAEATNEDVPIEPHASPVLERSDSAMAEEGRRVGEEEEEEEDEEDFGEEGDDDDKYAALREICSEPPQADEESDKEDSVTEATAEKLEDDFNLLTLSRQQSESPESLTLEAAVNVRETQSIIESTILEEELNIDVEEMSRPDSPENTSNEHIEQTDDTLRNITPESKTSLPERIAPPSELALHEPQEKEESWANFEDSNFNSEEFCSRHDEAVSPWSIDGRDFHATRPYKESPEATELRTNSRRRHTSRRESPWQDDDDEEWESRIYRENGWRECERRSRKKTPWSQGPPRRSSPWEDEDVEEYNEVMYTRPAPIRGPSSERRSHRPPSWEEEEPEYDEPPRRAVGWGRRDNEEMRQRASSRGEFIERRRWEMEEEDKTRRQASSKYSGSYATWGERGNKKISQERRNREAAAMRRKQYDSHYWHYRDQRHLDYDYDDPECYNRYKKKGAWPKRPTSASDLRKGPPVRGYQSPGSAHSHDPEEERHFRTLSGGEPDFNSDQEPEYIAERAREQYEQRSHTLYSRRNQKQKHSTRLSSKDFLSPQQKSPFEDDFSTQTFHVSEFCSIESPSKENNTRKHPQESVRRNDSQLSEAEFKLSSNSPMEEDTRGRDSKTSRGSSRRQSPFEDDFTPPETRRGSARIASSMSSDISERRSPHEEVPSRGASTAMEGSVAADDVFFPTPSSHNPELDPEHSEPKKLERRGWSEHNADSSSRQFAGMRNRLGVFRSNDSANIKKSESVNIFARDNDPFDDDFFVEDTAGVRRIKPSCEKPKNNNDSFSKWSEPFETFNFKEEDEQ